MKNLRNFFLLFALLVSVESHAFTLATNNENQMGWNSKTLVFHLNHNECGAQAAAVNAALDTAIVLWNSIPTSNIKLEKGSPSTTSAATVYGLAAPEGGVVISCSSNFGSLTGYPDSAGVSKVNAGGDNYLNKSGIILNLAYIPNYSTNNLASLLGHEMGHSLGLGHSTDPSAIMSYEGQNQELHLSQDDVDGITYLYPRDEFSDPASSFGCGTILPPGGGPVDGFGTFLAALLFPFGLLAWNRARTRAAALA